MSSHMKDGQRIVSRGNPILEHDVAKLLKTQDAGYLRTMLQKTHKDREKVEQEIQMTGEEGLKLVDEKKTGPGNGKHIVFVDSVEEQRAFDPKEWFETDEKGLEKTYNRQRRKSAPAEQDQENEEEGKSRVAKQKERRDLLEVLRRREQTIAWAIEELDIQRNKMNNNIGGVSKAGVKWKVRRRKK
jgi:U3 small nucleolar RNA-associated protein 11